MQVFGVVGNLSVNYTQGAQPADLSDRLEDRLEDKVSAGHGEQQCFGEAVSLGSKGSTGRKPGRYGSSTER